MYCDIPDFGRCCFCMPLRRGVLVFGYLNAIFSVIMIFLYSYHNYYDQTILLFKGATSHDMTPELCIALYCIDFIINCLLVYGAHMKTIIYLRIFYFYSITSMVAAFILQVVDFANYHRRNFEMLILAIAGTFIQLYLVLLVRSLLRKLENGSDHSIENQLHAIVTGEAPADRVYNNTTAPSAPTTDDF